MRYKEGDIITLSAGKVRAIVKRFRLIKLINYQLTRNQKEVIIAVRIIQNKRYFKYSVIATPSNKQLKAPT